MFFFSQLEINARGNDGDEIELAMPSKAEVSELVAKSEDKYRELIGYAHLWKILRFSYLLGYLSFIYSLFYLMHLEKLGK